MPKEQKLRTATSLRKVDLERRAFNPEWIDEFFFVQRGQQSRVFTMPWYQQHFQAVKSQGAFRCETRAYVQKLLHGSTQDWSCSLAVTVGSTVAALQKAGFQSVWGCYWCRLCKGLYSCCCVRHLARATRRFHGDPAVCPHCNSTRGGLDLWCPVFDAHEVQKSRYILYRLSSWMRADIKDTAQLAIFVRGVTHDIKVVGDFLSLISMKATTTGKDVLNALLPALNGFDLSKLVSVTTDVHSPWLNLLKDFRSCSSTTAVLWAVRRRYAKSTALFIRSHYVPSQLAWRTLCLLWWS